MDVLRQSATEYSREYTQLKDSLRTEKLETSVDINEVNVQLKQVDEKLARLLAGQVDVVAHVVDLKQLVTRHYEKQDRNLIQEIARELNHFQLETVHLVLNAVESDRIKEAELSSLLQGASDVLLHIGSQESRIIRQDDISEIIASPTLDLKHKIKITLPVIPLLLNYEAELAFGSGIKLEGLWNRIVQKVRGKK